MYIPPVTAIPTFIPYTLKIWDIIRAVVVLPLVPVMEIIGTECFAIGGNSISTIKSATFRGFPFEGKRCIRRPGAAFTSITAPPLVDIGFDISGQVMSTPATSSPII